MPEHCLYVKFIWEKVKGTLSFVVLDVIFWNFLYYPWGVSGEFWVLSPCVLRVYFWLFAGITPGGALLTICGTGESSQAPCKACAISYYLSGSIIPGVLSDMPSSINNSCVPSSG